jgi:hypothetical protein
MVEARRQSSKATRTRRRLTFLNAFLHFLHMKAISIVLASL